MRFSGKICKNTQKALDLKAEGKVKHVGISFHDRAEVLEQILTDYPEIEVVQIQFNYNVVHTAPGRKASDCIKCGKCEKVCPQHLPIRKLLEDVAKEFEKA